MRRSAEGSGRLKVVSTLAFIAAIIFVAIRTLPAYVNNYQLQDHIRQLSTQLAVRTTPATPDEVRNEVIAFAQDHGISLTAENVKVTISSHVSISLDYTVPVDLKVYTLKLHFSPSAENQSL
jgi:YbbR domain-containing protein